MRFAVRFFTALFLLFTLAISYFPSAAEAQEEETTSEDSQTYAFPEKYAAPVINQAEVEKILKTHGSDLIVVNFWATWCSPCIEEIPYFIKASKEYEQDNVRFIGISVDFKNQVEDRVIPKLKEMEIPYANFVLYNSVDDGGSEAMIEFFSSNWKGDIPATFFYNKAGEKVGEFLRPLEYEELKARIEELKPQKEEKPAAGQG